MVSQKERATSVLHQVSHLARQKKGDGHATVYAAAVARVRLKEKSALVQYTSNTLGKAEVQVARIASVRQ